MNDMVRKLTSRKLWAAAAGIVAGLAMVFGLDEGTISTVAGAVVSLASLVTYIVTEGKVDAQSAANTITLVQEAADGLLTENDTQGGGDAENVTTGGGDGVGYE